MSLARRLAMGALQRLAREVDRLSLALEPVRGGIALRETAGVGDEIDVTRWVAPKQATDDAGVPAEAQIRVPPAAPVSSPAEPAKEPPRSEAHAAELPLGVVQATYLRAYVEPHLAVLRAGTAWERADDPFEALHQLRVATRRLRAFTSLFTPMIGDKRTRRFRRRLRTMTRDLGPLREWDVLLVGLRAEHSLADSLTRAALEHVIAWVDARRSKTAQQARKALAEVDTVELAKALDAELDRVCGHVLRLDERLPAQVGTLLEPELGRAFDAMPRPEREDEVEALHELRKRAKQVRYALDLLRPSLGKGYVPLRRPLKKIQRLLGEHHDRALLAELLREHGEEQEAAGLPTLASALVSLEAAVMQRQRATLEEAKPAMRVFEHSRYVKLARHEPAPETTDEPGT